MKEENMIRCAACLVILISLMGLTQNTWLKKRPPWPPTDTIRIESGLISGTQTENGDLRIFKGIPYATPPVGDLRWKAPQMVEKWEGIRKCNVFGPNAAQLKPIPFLVFTSEFLIPDHGVSEDCLYLNIWTSAKSNREKRPVVVWIHGGGFVNGSGSVAIYDGQSMAKKGVIFVTINYRLGIFGFFSLPELSAESPHHVSGNYAIMDQIAALQWVHRNIEAFGGDPDNVTIDGQSAGSMSVNCLVASPRAKGLFRHAIAESGGIFIPNIFGAMASLKQDEAEGLRMEKLMQAQSLAELRQIPAAQLLAKAKIFGYGPTVDGWVLPQSIRQIFEAGKQNDADLLTGWNADDGLLLGPPQKAAGYRDQLVLQYGQDAKTFLQFYPAADDSEAACSQMAFSRDMIFGVQNYTWANLQSLKGKVYLYHFARRVPATGEYVRYGAFHSGEIVYVLDNLPFLHRPWEEVDRRLSSMLSSYWVNFVKTGDPNGQDLPNWPSYQTNKKTEMLFSETPAARELPNAPALDFLVHVLSKK